MRREEEEMRKAQARIAAERPVEFPVTKQPVQQYHISAFVNSFQYARFIHAIARLN